VLRSLAIRDFAIVERVELEFQRGFTALTGETGAGKSILIDALALVLGERAEAIVVRQGAARAEIAAEFDFDPARRLAGWLDEQDLGGDPGVCLVRRVIEANGRSRAFVNGRSVTLAQLREAAELLVNIHGQHEHQALSRASAQRELLDAYAGARDTSAKTAMLYREWQRRAGQRRAFETNAAAIAAEREQVEWQVHELAALGYTSEAWGALLNEHRRLAHAASLIEGAQLGLEALSEGEGAALAQLNEVLTRLRALVEHDSGLTEIVEPLESAAIQMQEAVYGLRHYQHKLEADPQRLRELEGRIDAVHSACRKYRTDPEELPAVLERAKQRLAELDTAGDAGALERLEQESRAAYDGEARKLSAAREQAAREVSTHVSKAMQALAMSGGTFQVALARRGEPAAHGLEDVEFRVAAHRSMTAQPLAKVASGGELSRLSLAIQTVTSRVAEVPTLVFDEVDAGIGGRVAEIVGRMLKTLGETHQVMCITHLPQVAASADHQWQVAKSATNAKVSSRVIALDPEQRVDEIARMLGGMKITETTRKHAAEMLKGGE
jgi:DNA repair protein RecN (Recombination protein N)